MNGKWKILTGLDARDVDVSEYTCEILNLIILDDGLQNESWRKLVSKHVSRLEVHFRKIQTRYLQGLNSLFNASPTKKILSDWIQIELLF